MFKEGRLTVVKKKGLDDYNKRYKMKSKRETYPLDESSPSCQYREEMDPYLSQ